MANQMFFQRQEMKYLLTRQQQEALLNIIEPEITADPYFHSSIRNLYYDTQNYQLIRTSLEKPIYKEKLRLRSYGRAANDGTVFVELKKKYGSTVFKRRVQMALGDAMPALQKEAPLPDCQIGREIDYFLHFYHALAPRVFLSYERDAYRGLEDPHFRITFDDEIRFRQVDLTLNSDPWGTPLLPEDTVLMELKVNEAMPLWMARALSQLGIYKISYSKYGAAYKEIQAGILKGALYYA